jgi:hypothetical protein
MKANYQVWVQHHLLVGEPIEVLAEQECIGSFWQGFQFDYKWSCSCPNFLLGTEGIFPYRLKRMLSVQLKHFIVIITIVKARLNSVCPCRNNFIQ